MRFMPARLSTTPPAMGRAPPVSPLPAPRGTTGTLWAVAAAMTRAIWAVSVARTTASGRWARRLAS